MGKEASRVRRAFDRLKDRGDVAHIVEWARVEAVIGALTDDGKRIERALEVYETGVDVLGDRMVEVHDVSEEALEAAGFTCGELVPGS